jgi:DNA-binding transcriptional regulator GbsR (MarR family)
LARIVIIVQYVLNDLDDTMDRAQRMFIDRLGDAAEADGLSPIAGRLFALLMLAAEPQSLEELADALGVSKASVSTDARRLLDRGIVERTRRTGDRRDFYELAPDFFARVIRARVARWRRIQQLVDDVRADTTALPAAASARFDDVDAMQSAVIDRVDEALAEWEREAQKRRATARATARAKRRSA